MGADRVFDLGSTSAEQRLEEIRSLTYGEGVDVVIEAAGSPAAIEEGLTLVRDGGRYVVAGHYTDAGPSSVNAHWHINRKHLEIRGCWGSEPGHFLRALSLARTSRVARTLARHRRTDLRARRARTPPSPTRKRCAFPRRSSIRSDEPRVNTDEKNKNHCHRRAREQLSRSPAIVAGRRREHLPSQFFSRHARVPRRHDPDDSAGRRGRRTPRGRDAGLERTEDPNWSPRGRTTDADRRRRAPCRSRRSAG